MVQITYPHIKAYLTMRTCGISLEDIQPKGHHQSVKDGEAVNNASDLSDSPLEICQTESHLEADISPKRLIEIDAVPSGPLNGCQLQKLPLACEGEFPSKRLKISETEEVSLIKLKATESSVVEWLKNYDEGVSEDMFIFHIESFMISDYILGYVLIKSVIYWFQANLNDILEHFSASNEDSIVELLSCLECDFMIYKKGNMYRAM
jgi:ATP-dependent DNA helicase RecQ